MNISELYMTLEVYAHLRELPEYNALKGEIQKKLKAENDGLLPKGAAKPVVVEAEPAEEEETRR